MSVAAGARGGYQYASVTTSGKEFLADRAYLVTEIHFFVSGGTVGTETVTLVAEGQSWFGGSAVPITLLQHVNAVGAFGANSAVVFRPERPILFTRDLSIKVTPSATLGVALVGELLEKAS